MESTVNRKCPSRFVLLVEELVPAERSAKLDAARGTLDIIRPEVPVEWTVSPPSGVVVVPIATLLCEKVKLPKPQADPKSPELTAAAIVHEPPRVGKAGSRSFRAASRAVAGSSSASNKSSRKRSGDVPVPPAQSGASARRLRVVRSAVAMARSLSTIFDIHSILHPLYPGQE